MKIELRAARRDEYPAVRRIIARAFAPDETYLWDYLVQNDPNLIPDGVRVAVAGGCPVACAVVLPRPIRARRGWTPGAIITLVCCDPDYQGQGFGSRAVLDALNYAAKRGLAVAMLYGHPRFYTRLGFVPVLPHHHADLAGETAPPDAEELLPAAGEDLEAIASLYERDLGTYPFAVARTPEPWLWSLRNQGRDAVLVLPDRQGYAVVALERNERRLHVHEAATSDIGTARRLLYALLREAARRGLSSVRLALPPDHLLVRLSLLGDNPVAQVHRPAQAGMATVLDWKPLLPDGYLVDGEFLVQNSRPLLQAGSRSLTELVTGYRGIDDLVLGPDCRMLGDGDDLTRLHLRLRADFPPGFPHWTLEPFWFGAGSD